MKEATSGDAPAIEHARELFRQELPPRPADVPFSGKPRPDGAKRQAAETKLASTCDRRLLLLVDYEAHTVGVDREAERH
jgi:hypothetical protein